MGFKRRFRRKIIRRGKHRLTSQDLFFIVGWLLFMLLLVIHQVYNFNIKYVKIHSHPSEKTHTHNDGK
ncbi:Uncharacterised protein [Chryseobacterium gleum]|jgi:hypothetical protein|uniref:Uncharacterized protein n=3 Tax=Chryseobacterium group TaxID=2782232 RepID=A0A1H6L1V1_9FLAO|nr:MAG: hypothetical protein BGO86_07775 [Chryseobacterium sp. 36-9]SEH82227.1 hypothetical protein SAMN05421793_13512 [Epilithonimonas hominis]SMP34485.1 hypothetical protein SAMN06264346_11818 [Chryseobacterium profundimaris]VEE07412.1 Uncharacterised protein [Chryseobacterium gleum]